MGNTFSDFEENDDHDLVRIRTQCLVVRECYPISKLNETKSKFDYNYFDYVNVEG